MDNYVDNYVEKVMYRTCVWSVSRKVTVFPSWLSWNEAAVVAEWELVAGALCDVLYLDTERVPKGEDRPKGGREPERGEGFP